MRNDFQRLMGEATDLTRGGRLQDATERIQAALRGLGAAGRARTDDDVIDVEARVVPEADDPVPRSLPPPQEPGNEAPPQSFRTAANDAGTAEAFLRGRHGGAGTAGRDYRLYVPPDAGTGPRPLVVMLHGCTQDPDDFAAGTRMNEVARAQGCLRAVPDAVAAGQSAALLELVQAQPPATRARRAGAAGRHDARGDGAACDRPGPRLRRGPVRRRRDGGDPGRTPIPTCSRRSASTPACRRAPPATCPRRWKR